MNYLTADKKIAYRYKGTKYIIQVSLFYNKTSFFIQFDFYLVEKITTLCKIFDAIENSNLLWEEGRKY